MNVCQASSTETAHFRTNWCAKENQKDHSDVQKEIGGCGVQVERGRNVGKGNQERQNHLHVSIRISSYTQLGK